MENGVCWGRLMRMRVAKDHGLRSWVRSIDRVEYGVWLRCQFVGRKRVEKLNNLIRQNRKAQLSASRQLHVRREEKI